MARREISPLTFTFNLCGCIRLTLWVSALYCWKEDFTLEWGCVRVSTSLVGLARLWYPSWAQIFPLYKRWKGFDLVLVLVQRVISYLSHLHFEWAIFISCGHNLLHCRVTHSFVYRNIYVVQQDTHILWLSLFGGSTCFGPQWSILRSVYKLYVANLVCGNPRTTRHVQTVCG